MTLSRLERATANAIANFRAPTSSVSQTADGLWRKGWKGCGKTRGQWDANGSIVSSLETASTSRISLPPTATGCPQSRMVRRGSTVRVRQRACTTALQIGMCGHSRHLGTYATMRSRHSIATRDPKSSCKAFCVARTDEEVIPSFAREGVIGQSPRPSAAPAT